MDLLKIKQEEIEEGKKGGNPTHFQAKRLRGRHPQVDPHGFVLQDNESEELDQTSWITCVLNHWVMQLIS